VSEDIAGVSRTRSNPGHVSGFNTARPLIVFQGAVDAVESVGFSRLPAGGVVLFAAG
jgi:hypothetical protein